MAINIDLGKVRFNWRGAWSSSTSYAANDVVSYGGGSFFCVTAHSGQTPNMNSDTSYWNKMTQGYDSNGVSYRADLRVRPSAGFANTYPYDYQSGYTNSGTQRDWTIKKMISDGKLRNVGNSGDYSSYVNSSWNHKNMVHVGYANNNFSSYAHGVKVPAGCDLVHFQFNGDAGHICLIDPSTGKSPCGKNSKDSNERVFRQTGNGGFFTVMNAHGNQRAGFHNSHGNWAEFAVPRLTVEKEYYLVQGQHSNYSRHGSSNGYAWLSGVSFGQNPWGFLQCPAGTAHYSSNGESSFEHSSWSWNYMPNMYMPSNSSRTLKFPVAPGVNGDIVIWQYQQMENHGHGLRRLVINGREYQWTAMTGSDPCTTYLQNRMHGSNGWNLMHCVVRYEDIPSDVRTNGGHLSVTMDTLYQNHNYHFGDYGSFFVTPTALVYSDGDDQTS